MTVEILTPTEEQWPEMFRADARGFGFVATPEDAEQRRPIIDLDRFRVAIDAGRIVGVAGSYALDVTLPGSTTVPMAAVTWVSVSATHRRRGVLTSLLGACHDDADDRGEPVAMLFASEGGIYERFGYGIATQMRSVTIARREARLRPDLAPDKTAVRYVDDDEARQHVSDVWERFRRVRAGEVTRSEAWHRHVFEMRAKPEDGSSSTFYLAHRDGYAAYRIAEKWSDGVPGHRLVVTELAAITPEAHLDLWHTVLGVDLVDTITTRALTVDDGLPYLLTDARVVATSGLKDGVWVNVRDVATCFGARQYGTADRLVVEVDGRRWAIESDGAEASCRSVRTKPDLVMDLPSLGALLLGGVRPSLLAAGRRLDARSAAALRRADAFFVVGPAPHCQTWY